MKLVWASEAEEELVTAARWYESRAPGLGWRFLAEVDRAADYVAALPLAWSRLPRTKMRRQLVRPFPWALIYTVDDGEIVIVALHHTRRSPRRLRTTTRRRLSS